MIIFQSFEFSPLIGVYSPSLYRVNMFQVTNESPKWQMMQCFIYIAWFPYSYIPMITFNLQLRDRKILLTMITIKIRNLYACSIIKNENHELCIYGFFYLYVCNLYLYVVFAGLCARIKVWGDNNMHVENLRCWSSPLHFLRQGVIIL